MPKNSPPKIIIIDESITSSTSLMVLLSTLSKDITICSTYARGLNAIEHEGKSGSPFEIIFIAYPPMHHEQEDIAIQILALSLQQTSPLHTVILQGDRLPPQFSKTTPQDENVLTKPITRKKLKDILATMNFDLPKLNCWEYMQCGREPGGRHTGDKGVCPAAVDQSGDGIHGGKNTGRACWASSGTLCGGRVQGSFACKITSCHQCDFYKLVQADEGEVFESIDSILRRMQHKKG